MLRRPDRNCTTNRGPAESGIRGRPSTHLPTILRSSSGLQRPHVRDDLGSRLLETIHVRDPILLYPRVRDDCWADDWDACFGSLLESARSVARKGTCAIVESRGSFQNGMSLGSNSACHGQATDHSTP